ncbi:hypothetical protein PuT2_06605 [Pusillimonas sp. T2]|nr:hypothetical protein PuT2_06605 [Pusillimonas sp. T2]
MNRAYISLRTSDVVTHSNATRPPIAYQAIYAFLKDCGFNDLENLNFHAEPQLQLVAGSLQDGRLV